MKYKINLTAIISVLIFSQSFAQNYKFEKIPDWVKTIPIPSKLPASKYEIVSGFYESLLDYQFDLDKNAMFCHEVRKVVSTSGITNASQVSVTFDPTYQKLYIHHLYIWRRWLQTDRTKELTMEIMNNEHNLQQGIYTGQITVYDILDDIRKDDMIDFAYTIVGKNPILENGKHLFMPMESINRIDMISLRIIHSKDENYKYECIGCDSLLKSSISNGRKLIEVVSEDVKAIKIDDNTPPWVIPYKYFLLSSFSSWREVNTWAQKTFALKSEPDLSEVFNEILKGNETTEQKITKIINYVQDDIRYMGVEGGIGSLKPQPPDMVVKKRYGDCKDKSLLLVSLLKKIGVNNAYPVLVNTQLQHEIEKLGPSNEVFNHCIVTFDYDSINYWVDPTMLMQGGDFKEMKTMDYGSALIIGKPSDTLQSMPLFNSGSSFDIVDEYTISSFTEPAKLKMISKRYGLEADNRRAFVEYYSSEQLLKLTMDDLKLQYPVVTNKSDLQIQDDIEKNIFTVTYNMDVDGFWQDGDKSTNPDAKGFWIFRYEPQMLYSEINVANCEDRKHDFMLHYPIDLNYRVIFNFPEPIVINDEYKSFDNSAFYFEEKIEQVSLKSVQVFYKYKTKSNHVIASEYKNICDEKNQIAKKFPLIFYFPK